MSWTRIRVESQVFETTLETVTTRFPNSRLAELFRHPFQLYNDESEEHVIPAGMCDEKSFEYILDFLRNDSWLPVRSQAEFKRLMVAVRLFRIDSAPKQTLDTTEPQVVKHLRVTLPTPTPTSIHPPTSGATLSNSCTMISGLAYRGFAVVDEGPAPVSGGAKATELVLRRDVAPLPALKMLANTSKWASLLHENA